MNDSPLSLRSVLGARFWAVSALALVLMTVLLAVLFIELDAFEAFYDYSRAHEAWDLDEVAMALLAAVVSCAVVGAFVALALARRLLHNETERQAAINRIQQAQNLIALGTMVGGTAHSINNHLLPIIALSDLLRSELPANSTQAHDLGKVLSAARSAADMVTRLKTFARSHQGMEGACEVGPVTERAIDLARRVAPTSVHFALDISPQPLWIAIAPAAWEIVVINLINNALDALQGAGGTLEVELQAANAPPARASATAAGPEHWVRLRVRDTGRGMNPEVLQRVFEPFFTTKPVGQGTGLGLSESYGIVDQAGGHFEVSSTEGAGTRIAVWLPTIQPAATAPNQGL